MIVNRERAQISTSEADWYLQSMQVRVAKYPEISLVGQRILDARITLASQEIPLIDDFLKFADAPYARPGKLMEQLEPVRAYERRTFSVGEAEQPFLRLAITQPEQALILRFAESDNETAQENLADISSLQKSDTHSTNLADFADGDLELMFDLADLDADPEYQAAQRNYEFERALREISVTQGVIDAIRNNTW